MKDNKIKIDYLLERENNQICGWRKVVNEVRKNIKDQVNEKIITYSSSIKLPYARYLNYLFIYPRVIKKEQREDTIKYLAHQELAYLYKYFNFKKSIIICHDIIPFFYPASVINKLFFLSCMKYINKATVIITDSDNTKEDLIKYFNCSSAKIHTIYPGVNDEFKQLKVTKGNIFKKYNIPSGFKYILYVGSEAKNKNMEKLLESFSKLEKENKLYLIKIGNVGDKSSRKKTLKIIRKLKIKNIKIIDFVPEKDLILFYNSVSLFVYPSLYEGFGLPPLEAMACGCPVITSDISSLPEVCGDSAYYIDPHDVNNIGNAIKKVLNDESLREKMIKRGLNQAKQFSWKKTAKETLAIYKEISNK